MIPLMNDHRHANRNGNEPHFVPKVHPATREVEAEDPMELVANPAPGDPDVMLDCIIQEFAWMGTGPEDLAGMFRDPEYPVLNQLRGYFGDAEVRRRIDAALGGFDAFRVNVTIDETPDPDEDHDDELIQIGLRTCG